VSELNAKIKNETLVTEAITTWYESHEYGPSFRDVAEITGLSLGTVHNTCKDLKERGMVYYQENVARTLTLKG
jgi:DNA-binding transcriptional regulator YhcF (GntR family)